MSPRRNHREDRPDARADMRPFPPAPAPGQRVGLRVSEQCLIRFNGVSGIKETVTHTEHGRAHNERLGEVSEPLS